VNPDIAVKELPEFVEWNNPASLETQTSPVALRLTTILTGEVEEPRLPEVAAKLEPVLVDR